MKETTANEFRKRLKYYVDISVANHNPLRINRRNGENFVVIGEADWKAIEETLYLNQFAGLVESIHSAAAEALNEGTPLEDLHW